jgi:hypothetical protein
VDNQDRRLSDGPDERRVNGQFSAWVNHDAASGAAFADISRSELRIVVPDRADAGENRVDSAAFSVYQCAAGWP